MAFRKRHLLAIGGFDRRFRTAGDDVDACWRIQEQAGWLAFSPGAMVWHHRRNSIRAYARQQRGYGRAETILEQKWPEKYNSLGHLNWKGRIYGNGLTQAISWRKWRIYHGTWGSAAFQSLYGPAAGVLASWPVMPEWYLLNGALLTLSLMGLLWKPLLLALPLLILTSGLSLISIVKSLRGGLSPDRPRAAPGGMKAAVVTGLLHALQPLARLHGRFGGGLTPWRRRGSGRFRLPTPYVYNIWSERWRSSQHWLESTEKALRHHGAIVLRGGGFDHWDLEIRGGLSGACRVRMAIEEHGSGRQLIRLKVWPKISGLALSIAFGAALLSVLAAADHAAATAVMLGLAALILGLHPLGDCAAAKATCHTAICSLIPATGSEGAGMSPVQENPTLVLAQTDSIFDLAVIRKTSQSPNFTQNLAHESESPQQ
jgi:hypothetical protein